MNCARILESLANGEELSAEAKLHVASCKGCAELLASFDRSREAVSQERLRAIESSIHERMRPVKPLPSNAALIAMFLATVALTCAIAGGLIGIHGFRNMTAVERWLYLGAAGISALLLSFAMAREMIPASGIRFTGAGVVILSLALPVFSTIALFPATHTEPFVTLGVHCFQAGFVAALLSAILLWILIRRGFFTSPLDAGMTGGALAGCAGFIVLAFHCANFDALHILAWHLGPMVTAIGIGCIVGYVSASRV